MAGQLYPSTGSGCGPSTGSGRGFLQHFFECFSEFVAIGLAVAEAVEGLGHVDVGLADAGDSRRVVLVLVVSAEAEVGVGVVEGGGNELVVELGGLVAFVAGFEGGGLELDAVEVAEDAVHFVNVGPARHFPGEGG